MVEVWVNDVGVAAYESEDAEIPVGTIVVKTSHEKDGSMGPIFVMEKVSAWLEAHPGKHSRSAVVDAIKARAGDVRESLDHLTASGHVHEEVTERGSRTDRHYRHAKRFKVGQTEEDE